MVEDRSTPPAPPPGGESASRPGDDRRWLPMFAFVFVLLSLITLATVPGVLLHRLSSVMEDLTGEILPANNALRNLAFAMEERVAASRSIYLSADPVYELQLEQARVREAEALGTLRQLAPRIGLNTAHLDNFERHMASRDSIEAGLIRGGEQIEPYLAALPYFDAIRDSMLVEVAGFQQELRRISQTRIAEESRWVELQRILSIVLGIVTLLAMAGVGWFGFRERQLRRDVQNALAETDRQRAIAERRRGELEQATEARARLLRGVTHDVKNPLGAAKGYAELLEMEIKAPVHPDQRPLLGGIKRSVDSALATLSDLLDLARADSGGLTLNRTEIDLGALVREAAGAHRTLAEAAGHELHIAPPSGELKLYTDAARVDQVLGNILSNAIKYTPAPGQITVRPLPQPRDGDENWIAVRVEDTGPGVPPDQREAIFDEFTRLSDGGSTKGHGLGLAIARRISRMLGGDLTVEDAPGGGACFILWLPARAQDQPLG